MFGLSTLKLIGIGVGALAVIALLALVNTWRVGYHDRGEKLATICSATRAASGQPKLRCGEVPAQIQFLGETVGTLKRAITEQNAKVAAMGAETARQQELARQAVQNASGRAKRASAASEGLQASSRAGERYSAPCQPSDKLKEQWK
jgi:hypothetical protein